MLICHAMGEPHNLRRKAPGSAIQSRKVMRLMLKSPRSIITINNKNVRKQLKSFRTSSKIRIQRQILLRVKRRLYSSKRMEQILSAVVAR